MAQGNRPECEKPAHQKHPDTYTRKAGRYGSEGQYQRWQCVPGNGDDPHYINRTLPRRKVGGHKKGMCPECFRPWGEGDGIPAPRGHAYTIHDVATALSRLAAGASYREASRAARRRAGKKVTKYGRLARDWVAQYAPILRAEHLKSSWPEVLVVDHLTFKRRTAGGIRDAFYVMAALSYDDGSIEAAQKRGSRTPKLWLLRADTQSDQAAWQHFFSQLDGQPKYVVADRHGGLRGALESHWPETTYFPCTWHLHQNLERRVRKGDLQEEIPEKFINPGTFTTPKHYSSLVDRVADLLQRGREHFGFERETQEKKLDGLKGIDDWLDDAEEDIERALDTPHAPLTTGGLEKPLRNDVKNALDDRAHLFDNLERLNHLLVLMQLNQLGYTNERDWASLLMGHLESNSGTPGHQRRAVDATSSRIHPHSPYA